MPRITLEAAEGCRITDAEAERLTGFLPDRMLRDLALGPILGEDAPCRVCETVVGLPSSGPAAVLVAWHLGVDLFGPDPERVGSGAECFRRCLVIYRAAGWRAPEGEP